MVKKNRVAIFILASVLIICVFAFMGFKVFFNAIYNQRTCEWANIDNIELHAQMDVPKVTKWECEYEKDLNIKRAYFTIDTNEVDLDQYLQSNNLEKAKACTDFEYDIFLKLNPDSLNKSAIYYKGNVSNGKRCDVLFDRTTNKLWITIKYND